MKAAVCADAQPAGAPPKVALYATGGVRESHDDDAAAAALRKLAVPGLDLQVRLAQGHGFWSSNLAWAELRSTVHYYSTSHCAALDFPGDPAEVRPTGRDSGRRACSRPWTRRASRPLACALPRRARAAWALARRRCRPSPKTRPHLHSSGTTIVTGPAWTRKNNRGSIRHIESTSRHNVVCSHHTHGRSPACWASAARLAS